MTNEKKFFVETGKKVIKKGAVLAAVFAMSYIGAKVAIETTRFEIHLFGPDGNDLGYVS